MPVRFRLHALERLKRVQQALAQRDWLGFAIEVIVVTVGVLIAILADQLVDNARWRREVIEFRRAVDRDIAWSLAAYQVRLRQSDCVERRIDELERWRESWREGRPLRLGGDIGRPLIAGTPTSAWESRSGELMLHMPYRVRRDYGSINGQLAYAYRQISEEREVWQSLSAFNGASQLSNDNLLRLNELIYRAATYNRNHLVNSSRLMKTAAQLEIRPSFEGDPILKGFETDGNPELCTPILEVR